MSALLSDPRVTVRISHAFRFLLENKSTYDVTITDSSDSVGSAAPLFEKPPSFSMMQSHLAGTISTEAECLWLHPQLFHELRWVVIAEGKGLVAAAKPYQISPPFVFVAFPNHSLVPFSEFYGIPEAHTAIRDNLMYQGSPEFVKSLVALALLSANEKDWLKEDMSWAEVLQNTIGATESGER